MFQIERAGQWTKGKGCETFGPLGPWMVTKDEIKDPQNLNLWLNVNGEKRQKGNTKTMVFGVAHIVWACSQYFILEPGDVIITGTPSGVALGMKPEPKFLKVGDVVHLGIDGLGEQKQKIVKARVTSSHDEVLPRVAKSDSSPASEASGGRGRGGVFRRLSPPVQH